MSEHPWDYDIHSHLPMFEDEDFVKVRGIQCHSHSPDGLDVLYLVLRVIQCDEFLQVQGDYRFQGEVVLFRNSSAVSIKFTSQIAQDYYSAVVLSGSGLPQ